MINNIFETVGIGEVDIELDDSLCWGYDELNRHIYNLGVESARLEL
jgi:hypothetical protein